MKLFFFFFIVDEFRVSDLVQLSAEALKNVVFVDLENRLPLVEDGVNDHAQRVHVGGGVTADRQDVLGRQVLGVGEAEGGQVGLPLFTGIFRLKTGENTEKCKINKPAE